MVKPRRTTEPSTNGKHQTPELPEVMQMYQKHGMDIIMPRSASDTQARTDCVFCQLEGKMFINIHTGLWDCKVCGLSGNPIEWLRQLHKHSMEATPSGDYEELAEDRGLVETDSLVKWGVCRSIVDGEWMIPSHSLKEDEVQVSQLYRWTYMSGKRRPLATKGFGHQIHGMHLWDHELDTVLLAEGPWDAIALWEAVRGLKSHRLIETIKDDKHIGDACNVIGVPGSNVWHDSWNKFLRKKKVVMLYDNDHPREVKGNMVAGAGIAGMKKVTEEVTGDSDDVQPASMNYLRWGTEGYDPDLPNGADLRDWFAGAKKQNKISRGKRLSDLLDRVEPVPEGWRNEAGSKGRVKPTFCSQWTTVREAWETCFEWTDGLDRALSVMLACVVSTNTIGDPLWCKVLGPPGCGKSSLAEAISVCRKYVDSRSTFTGFHSGYKSDSEGKEDNSLIKRINGKTFIIKDGDTLMKQPNVSQILSEARDIYDGKARTHYRNKVAREYESIKLTIILCGTGSLASLDNSELGERFIQCTIMEHIDPKMERSILEVVARRACAMVQEEGSSGKDASPDMLKAQALTGGYVQWIREHASEIIGNVRMEEDALHQCVSLATSVAYLRARPSKIQDEVAEREFAARLTSQFVRLARCLAAVMNKTTVDAEVMRRVRQCALDSSKGKVLTLVRALYKKENGAAVPMLLMMMGDAWEESELKRYLRFLQKIGVVELRTSKVNRQRNRVVKGTKVWMLTDEVRRVFQEVYYEMAGSTQ